MPHKKVNWIELFYDLIYVAAIATATHTLLHVEDQTIPVEYMVKFILIFIPIWWAWVGQTLFVNRYGEDTNRDRIWMSVQMVFVILMTASLSVDFDTYYLPFLIGYLGVRLVVSIQYISAIQREVAERKMVAKFLGYGFLIGALISLGSLLFDSWIKYFVLYLGISVDIVVPLIGRKHIKKVPINTPHLLERFGLLTIILFGEFIVSIVSIIEVEKNQWNSIGILLLTFTLVMAMWWQYFDTLEKKVNKEYKTSGQLIVYGHLIIFMSMSVIASVIQLGFLYDIGKDVWVAIAFASTLIYVGGTSLVFHKYRYKTNRLKLKHYLLLVSVNIGLFISSLLLPVDKIIVLIQLACFFVFYAYITTKNK
ncbi:low temperature requirement protein A [Sutcliffiella horikoshii]|uniref:Low temperature requirement protein A n=1 Tax=Sutcliffiella horikoshii TaxID=79883 RepID=A0A5D4T265_9BACI|nr:low temperature requirement protein A [Sutcliffiella horikoshii]TYS69777.1 low temperature requirement protein A [Sutcliffiella horikoshii]